MWYRGGMLLSLFTPTHRPIHLTEVYDSLLKQQGQVSFEWVIVPNGGVSYEDIAGNIRNDTRVRIVPSDLDGIGALKNFACHQCNGDVLVEMDHDDILAPNAFEELAKAHMQEPDGFYYSDFVNVKSNGQCETFHTKYGWETYRSEINGHSYIASRAFAPTARSLCQIFFAPNHVRAWSRTAYGYTGGHDPALKIGDDHDLLCRTFINGTPFVWIKQPLYIYRRYNENSFIKYNKEIQTQQQETCNRYLHQLITADCRRNHWPAIDIGRAARCNEGYTSHDVVASGSWLFAPYADNSVGCVHAVDAFQRIPRQHIVTVMNEIYRVLVPGGWLISSTPALDDGEGRIGRGAFQDPSHCSYWSENNFTYFCQKRFSVLLPEYRGRFQSMRIWTHYPSDYHKQNVIPYVSADLCALKGQRQPGECAI